jgi:hypothetical protein
MSNPFTKEDAMLTAPTLEPLHTLRLTAMAAAWTAQPQHAELSALSFDERFALLVDAEWRARENTRLTRALQEAKFKLPHTCLEAIDYPDLNGRVMRQYQASRRELFGRLDRPALRPLPAEAFISGEWKTARVNLDYHVELHRHDDSVPFPLVHEVIDARLTATTVECFHRGQRVAAHLRDDTPGRHTTPPAHMPKAHQRHLEWTPSRLTEWAGRIGPQTQALVAAILADRPHPEQGDRSCLGLLRLGRRYGEARLEAACARAVAVGARSSRHVDSILKHGLEHLPLRAAAPSPAGPAAAHVLVDRAR